MVSSHRVHVSENAPSGWQSLVEKDSSSVIYAHEKIIRLYAETFRHKSVFFSVYDTHDRLVGGVCLLEKKAGGNPLSGLARIAYAYAPPSFSSPSVAREVIPLLFDCILEYAKKNRVVSLSLWSSPYFPYGELVPPAFERGVLQNVVVDLSPGSESLLAHFDKSLRKNIRSGEENKMVIREGNQQDMDAYYRAYTSHHSRMGLESYPRSFFEGLVRIFEEEKIGHFWVVEKDGCFAAGLMVSAFNGRLYEMAIASDPTYNAFFPNDLLKWHGIEYGCSHGLSVFDLSNIDPHPKEGSSTEGVNRYKKKWGSVVPYSVFKAQHGLVKALKGLRGGK